MAELADQVGNAPAAALALFGYRQGLAERYVELLRVHGSDRGVIGPRELCRLWDRHVLNSAVIEELVPHGSSVVDVGSGAGLPGVPLAIARPDLDIVLLEPMARRIEWLQEVVHQLEVGLTIVRGRAEDEAIRDRIGGVDVVTARAVAPLGRLAGWCVPVARRGGVVLAMKGAKAADEVARDWESIRSARARDVQVLTCGSERVADPATVVSMTRGSANGDGTGAARRTEDKRSRRSHK